MKVCCSPKRLSASLTCVSLRRNSSPSFDVSPPKRTAASPPKRAAAASTATQSLGSIGVCRLDSHCAPRAHTSMNLVPFAWRLRSLDRLRGGAPAHEDVCSYLYVHSFARTFAYTLMTLPRRISDPQ